MGDYVTGKRQAEDATVLDDNTSNKLLNMLFFSQAPVPLQIKVLRAASHHINLTAKQLRQLMGAYEDSTARSELFVLLYFRVTDIHNEKIFRVGFADPQEYAKLQGRLGYATMFPFVQPEQLTFSYDLRYNDQRIAALMIFKLCNSEGLNNLKDAVYVATEAADPMDETNFWRAQKEGIMDKCPPRGLFQGRYICAPESRDFKLRKKLLETYGFWVNTAKENDVLWWASLFECPPQVLEFLEWLLPRFPKDLDAAFYKIDGSVPGGSVSNGEVTLKEFEAGVLALGCKKFDGPNEKQEIAKVFRFLDPTGEGTISLGEWSVLKFLWREIQLACEEFCNFLERTVGDTLESWWKMLDEDGSGTISFQEWSDICWRLGFFGATKQIFSFIDKDDEGNVSSDEFQELKVFRAQR